ncbi:MAG: OmpA family protein, partial [Actinomycetia bacterium]|nr:OmpA family protein [Actinomycetes bacterium]
MRIVGMVLAVVVFGVACGAGSDDAGVDETTPEDTVTTSTSAEPAPTTDASTTMPDSTTSEGGAAEEGDSEAGQLPEGISRVDHLTLASGVTVSSFSGDGGAGHASTALRAIDGSATQIGFSLDDAGPSVYVFELPAATTFDTFAVPGVMDSPGNTTFFGSIEIAGSATAADDGFEVLVSDDFVALESKDDLAVFEPSEHGPVRWVRLTLSGALVVKAEHGTGNTSVRFTELIGNGVQADQTLDTGFTGIWDFRFVDAPDNSGPLLELKQHGATLVGCVGPIELTGTVTGSVARLEGIDTRNDRPSVYLFTLSPDGELRGVESTNNGVFRARLGPVAEEGSTTPCSEIETQLPGCGSTVYVNFDLDSADIRPDSAQVLVDVFDGLQATGATQVVIEGHTSTEGTTGYNQDLSERRARAVVDDLVAKGLDS